MQHLWRRCAAAFALAAFGETSQAQDYYPKPESQGGWRALVEPNATPSAEQKAFVRQVTGLDWDRLEDAWQVVAPHGGELLVIRAGWIAGEWGPGQTYHVASCTKSLTALAMARLFDLSESGELSVAIEPSSAARDFLPAAWGAKPGAGAIELRHLMTMSSGLAAHDAPAPNGSYAEVVLDQPIAAPPNTVWAYSSASVDLLSYAVEGATGDTLAAFFAEEIAAPLGMKPFVWQSMGEHTVASAYAYLAPRELARVGYLMLREGRWGAGPAWQQVVSAERITAMTTWAEELGSTTFQEPSFFTNDPESHLRYGELVWTNHVENGFVGQHLPADAWYMAGYATNLCLVVPSLDLVVVRLGKGPKPWDDALVAAFGDAIAEAVVSDPLPYASASPMGPSCGGPSLASSSPALGGTLSLRTQGLAPGGVAFLILGDALASGIPLGEGCPLIVAPSTALVLPPLSADASGEVLLSLPLSADPSTAGSSVAIQVLGWPGTTLFDFSLSNGVMLWIGS